MLVVSVTLAACGGEPDPPPSERDIARIGSALGGIVLECESVAAGFVAEPDRALLERGVEALIAVFDRVSPDAGYTAGTDPGPTRRTTARDELRLAQRTLAPCEPLLAERIDRAVAREE